MKNNKPSVYEIVTNKLIEKLEQGTAPWVRTWDPSTTSVNEPTNYVSKKPYSGINRILTWIAGYDCPYWVTFKQAKELGGSVRKGQKSTPVIFYQPLYFDADGNRVNDPRQAATKKVIAKSYAIFNLQQCDGIELPQPAAVPDKPELRIEACEEIILGWKTACPIKHGGDRAYYRPSTDSIQLPERESFHNPEAYYATAFHEAVHATGHESRLNRDSLTSADARFGSEVYSKEELVAEFGAAFLCSTAGILNSTINNSASYLQGWIRKLKNDSTLAVRAAALAQKAADHILNKNLD